MARTGGSRPEHLLVDGYNLIKAAPNWRHGLQVSLEAARAALEDALLAHAGRTDALVTLFYDGDSGAPADRDVRHRPRLEVVFSRPPDEADDLIKRAIERRHGARYLRVITSDREIRRFARRHRVRSTPSVEFAEELESPVRPAAAGAAPPPLEFDPNPRLDPEEIESWERIFSRRQDEEDPGPGV